MKSTSLQSMHLKRITHCDVKRETYSEEENV